MARMNNWTYEEFHAFTMMYAANADGEITPEERKVILSNLTETEYDRIKAIFLACDDAASLDIILSYKDKYCRSQADKDKILADMMAIYQADASFDQIERGVHQLFKRMI